jgi:hypothetical protein
MIRPLRFRFNISRVLCDEKVEQYVQRVFSILINLDSTEGYYISAQS